MHIEKKNTTSCTRNKKIYTGEPDATTSRLVDATFATRLATPSQQIPHHAAAGGVNGRPIINTVPGRLGGGFIYTFGRRHGRPNVTQGVGGGVRGRTGCKVSHPNGFHWCFLEAGLMSKSLLERGRKEGRRKGRSSWRGDTTLRGNEGEKAGDRSSRAVWGWIAGVRSAGRGFRTALRLVNAFFCSFARKKGELKEVHASRSPFCYHVVSGRMQELSVLFKFALPKFR